MHLTKARSHRRLKDHHQMSKIVERSKLLELDHILLAKNLPDTNQVAQVPKLLKFDYILLIKNLPGILAC